MKQMNKNGVGLIELMIAGMIAAGVIFMIVNGIITPSKVRERVMARGEFESDIFNLMQQIIQIGQLAQTTSISSCTKSASPVALECYVDFSNPPSGEPFTKVRWELSGTQLVYKRDANKNGVFDVDETVRTYEGVASFEICDDNNMKNGTCAIQPTKISDEHKKNIDLATPIAQRTPTNRFFRFRIVGTSSSPTAAGAHVDFQGAFYVRNPTPFTSIAYQWGGAE